MVEAAAALRRPQDGPGPESSAHTPAPGLPVLTRLHGRVPGVHRLQNLVHVLLQPAHGGRLLPEEVGPPKVQAYQLAQGGGLAVSSGACETPTGPGSTRPPVPVGIQGVLATWRGKRLPRGGCRQGKGTPRQGTQAFASVQRPY